MGLFLCLAPLRYLCSTAVNCLSAVIILTTEAHCFAILTTVKARKRMWKRESSFWQSSVIIECLWRCCWKIVRFHQRRKGKKASHSYQKSWLTLLRSWHHSLSPNPDEGLAGCPEQTSSAQGEPRHWDKKCRPPRWPRASLLGEKGEQVWWLVSTPHATLFWNVSY